MARGRGGLGFRAKFRTLDFRAYGLGLINLGWLRGVWGLRYSGLGALA